jgi:hypothetical protein
MKGKLIGAAILVGSHSLETSHGTYNRMLLYINIQWLVATSLAAAEHSWITENEMRTSGDHILPAMVELQQQLPMTA